MATHHLHYLHFARWCLLASLATLLVLPALVHTDPVVILGSDSTSTKGPDGNQRATREDTASQRSFPRSSDIDTISSRPSSFSSSSTPIAGPNAPNASVTVETVDLIFPTDGVVSKAPIFALFDVHIADLDERTDRYVHMKACVEMDQSASSVTLCYPIARGAKIVLENVAPGRHSLRVVIVEGSVNSSSQGSVQSVKMDATVANEGEEEERAVVHKRASATDALTQEEPVLRSALLPSVRELRVSDEIHFTVLDDVAFERHRSDELEHLRQQSRLPPPEHDDIVQWMQAHERHKARVRVTAVVDAVGTSRRLNDPHDGANTAQWEHSPQFDLERAEQPLIVIGVKTSVTLGFAQRQGIRDTWASQHACHPAVRVLFVGCRPVIPESTASSSSTSSDDTMGQQQFRFTLERSIETEKRVFRDLLTHELDCDDSYYTLADKVKHFLHFATTAFPNASYIMVIDDDAYVRTHELVAMVDAWPRQRLYAGHVARTNRALFRPLRDPGHKNYLSYEQYASPELPPFAFGCHFLLSADCARFVGANYRRLQGLAGLDDISVALWMLAIQVHPTHVERFTNLDTSVSCRDSFVSFADLSPSAMRIAHANVAANRSFCADFEPNMWHKATAPAESVQLVSTVVRSHESRRTHVVTNVTVRPGSRTHSFTFFPATQLLDDIVPVLCLDVKHHVVPAGFECAHFSLGLRDFMLGLTRNESHVSSAHVQLLAHNLQLFGTQSPVVTVVFSASAASITSMLECILTAVFTHARVRIVDDDAVARPNVAVFSTLDSSLCRSDSHQQCREAVARFMRRYSAATSLIIVTRALSDVGELLDPRVVVLTATTSVENDSSVHIPVASMSFSDRVSQSPSLLLLRSAERRQRLRSPTASSPSPFQAPRKFCAYMYARCDPPQREYMFDLLNAMEPVDALGVCQGSVRGPNYDRRASRHSPVGHDDAVASYAQYKFVLAFESAQRPGYVTEKLVNAFLAGSVPVYFGHSDSVVELFNPRSFIDCGRFRTLRACAERVLEVHRSNELYERIVAESAVVNVTRFYELFSWHPDVPSSYLTDRITSLLRVPSERR